MIERASAPPTAQQQAVSRQTAAEHDALLAAMQTLERALAAAAPGREAVWAQRVAADLPAVRHALLAHQHSAEGPDGVFAELHAVMPQASYRLGRLREAHTALLAAVAELESSLTPISAGEPVAFDAIRLRAATLLSDLRRHQAQEVDLVYEAFCRDLGSVD